MFKFSSIMRKLKNNKKNKRIKYACAKILRVTEVKLYIAVEIKISVFVSKKYIRILYEQVLFNIYIYIYNLCKLLASLCNNIFQDRRSEVVKIEKRKLIISIKKLPFYTFNLSFKLFNY